MFNRRFNIRRFIPTRKNVSDNFFAGERGKGKGTNEFLCGPRHDDLHTQIAFLQKAQDFGRLVGGNSAADAKGYLHESYAAASLAGPSCPPFRQQVRQECWALQGSPISLFLL